MPIQRRDLLNGSLAMTTFASIGPDNVKHGPHGSHGISAGVVESRRVAEAGSWAREFSFLYTHGDRVAGDGGGALWRRAPTNPGHAAVFQSADGQWWELAETTITPQMFGANGDGSARNDIPLEKMRSYAALRNQAGNTVRIVWPAGRYVYSSSPNWAINRLHMHFEGEVWLINLGTGDSFVLDGGASGTGIYGIQITGYPQIYGGPTTRNGLYARAIYRSKLEINCRGAGASSSGFHGEWLVSNDIHFIMNGNEGGLYSTPAQGLFLTRRGDGEESSYNSIWNFEASHLPVGVHLDGSLGNIFYGGASQANTVGLKRTRNAWNDKFVGVDFEVNEQDVEDGGREAQFIGCDFQRGPVFKSHSVNASVIGGATENLTVESNSAGVLFSGVTYNRFGSGTITDHGFRTRYRDLRNKAANEVHNTPRSRLPLRLVSSPFIYENNTGNAECIIVSGGTISRISLNRIVQDSVGLTSGQFLLGPGDSIFVEYSNSPTIVKWSL